MTESEFILTQERIENIEAHCASIEKDMTEYMEKNPKGNDQWLEARVRLLEEQVKELRESRNAARTKADSRCHDTNELSSSDIPIDSVVIDDSCGQTL